MAQRLRARQLREETPVVVSTPGGWDESSSDSLGEADVPTMPALSLQAAAKAAALLSRAWSMQRAWCVCPSRITQDSPLQGRDCTFCGGRQASTQGSQGGHP